MQRFREEDELPSWTVLSLLGAITGELIMDDHSWSALTAFVLLGAKPGILAPNNLGAVVWLPLKNGAVLELILRKWDNVTHTKFQSRAPSLVHFS